MPSIFVRLPEVISLEIVYKWCDILKLGNFDTAFCSNTERELMLRILNDKQFEQKSIDIDFTDGKVSDCYVPNCARNVVLLFDFDFRNNALKFSIKSFDNLRKVVYFNSYRCDTPCGKPLNDLINKCVNLKELHIFSDEKFDAVVKLIRTEILSQLSELSVHVSSSVDVYTHLAVYCRSLKMLYCNLHVEFLSLNTLKELLINNPLESLTVQINNREINEILEYIAFNGSRLRKLDLLGDSCLDVQPRIDSIRRVLANNPQLSKLEMSYCFTLNINNLSCILCDSAYYSLINMICGTKLRTLTLQFKNISEQLIHAIADNCPVLTRINLYSGVSLSGLKYLLTKCTELTSFATDHSQESCTEKYLSLLSTTNKLTYIHIRHYCSVNSTVNWKAETIIGIIDSCKHLLRLELQGIMCAKKQVTDYCDKIMRDSGRLVRVLFR